jgi:hypothetical protein
MGTRFYFLEPKFDQPEESLETLVYQQLASRRNSGEGGLTSAEICAAIMRAFPYYQNTCGSPAKFAVFEELVEEKLRNSASCKFDLQTERFCLE